MGKTIHNKETMSLYNIFDDQEDDSESAPQNINPSSMKDSNKFFADTSSDAQKELSDSKNNDNEKNQENPSLSSSGLETIVDPYAEIEYEDPQQTDTIIDPRNAVQRAAWMDEGFGTVSDKRSLKELGEFSLDKILADAIDAGAADVKIKAYDRIVFKILGKTARQEKYGIIQPEIIKSLYNIEVEEVLKADFARNLGLDTAYTLTETRHAGNRARLSVGKERGEIYMVFRLISNVIPTPEELGIPQEILNWTKRGSGSIFICGETGSGKSTTMASILNRINTTEPLSIITLEKPIEYILSSGKDALGDVYQRDVGPGLDTVSFAQGLKDALRQSPDIILVGEVRDREELTTLMEASDSGHLSLTTMHTNSAPQTISRIKNLFEKEQGRILDSLSSNVIGFTNQLLILTPDKTKRKAIREILSFDDDEVRKLVKKGKDGKLLDYQIEREATMEHALARGIASGEIDRDEAMRKAGRPPLVTEALKKIG